MPPQRGSGSGRCSGRVRRSPAGVTNSARPHSFRRRHRPPGKAGIALQQGLDLPLAFLRLQRADAIDQHAARLGQLDRAVEQARLQPDQRRDVGLALEPGHVGMAADGAGRGAGRIEQYRVERLGICDSGAIPPRRRPPARPSATGGRSFLPRAPAAPASGRPRSPARRASASCAVLPPGAAHRSATRKPRTSPNRRAGREAAASCTHQAPSRKPGSSVIAPLRQGAHAAGRQHAAVHVLGQGLGVGQASP